ncbi:conjugal transfer protein TraF [candidate division KSB1 bacterium]
MKVKTALTSLALILIYTSVVFAQSGSSLGIGGNTAISRGVDAVYWNPANLAFEHKDYPKFQMILYSFTAGGGNNSFSFNTFNDYIGDGESIYLTEDDKNSILDEIDDDGLKFDASMGFSALSFRYKNFGVGIEGRVYGNVKIPKAIYRNLLFKIGHETYDYSVDGEGVGVGKLKFSYGRTIVRDKKLELPFGKSIYLKEISAGLSFSYLTGLGFGEVEEGTAKIDINDNGILADVETRAKYALMGSGIGIDLGFGAITNDGWNFGLVIENLVGSINWDDETELTSARLDVEDRKFAIGAGQWEDAGDDGFVDTTYAIPAFSKSLPTNFRIGIAKELSKKFLVNFEFANENKNFFTSVGGRFKLGILHLFFSLKNGMGNIHWNTAFALDLKNFIFDIGVSSRSSFSFAGSKGFFVGSTMRIGF